MTRYDNYIITLTHIALVLNQPVSVVVDDVVGNVVGDLGEIMELLDALLGVESLPIIGWIEKKETVLYSPTRSAAAHYSRLKVIFTMQCS